MKIFLGLDWGKKRIGMSLGDDETKIASPFGVAKSLKEVLNVVKAEEIDEVVIGKPCGMSNVEFQVSGEYNDFLNALRSKINIPVFEFDERLSSKAADARVGDKKTKAGRDEVAAMIILQDYFDSIN